MLLLVSNHPELIAAVLTVGPGFLTGVDTGLAGIDNVVTGSVDIKQAEKRLK